MEVYNMPNPQLNKYKSMQSNLFTFCKEITDGRTDIKKF